jgi:hypothetical protein
MCYSTASERVAPPGSRLLATNSPDASESPACAMNFDFAENTACEASDRCATGPDPSAGCRPKSQTPPAGARVLFDDERAVCPAWLLSSWQGTRPARCAPGAQLRRRSVRLPVAHGTGLCRSHLKEISRNSLTPKAQSHSAAHHNLRGAPTGARARSGLQRMRS